MHISQLVINLDLNSYILYSSIHIYGNVQEMVNLLCWLYLMRYSLEISYIFIKQLGKYSANQIRYAYKIVKLR